MHTGVRAPLYANSSGKIFLAWMPPAEREAYLRRVPLVPLTDTTLRSASALRKQLQAIKSEGVSMSYGEFTPGIVGIAVPVLDVGGALLAALGLAIPIERFDGAQQGAVKALHRCAAQIGAGFDRRVPEASSHA